MRQQRSSSDLWDDARKHQGWLDALAQVVANVASRIVCGKMLPVIVSASHLTNSTERREDAFGFTRIWLSNTKPMLDFQISNQSDLNCEV